jgi:hypothetical protein
MRVPTSSTCLRRLRRGALLALLALGVAAPVAGGSPARSQALVAPTGLEAFQNRLGDAETDVPSFSRSPSLAWNPVRGAARYQLELSTAARFSSSGSIVFTAQTATVPAAAIPISLPWMTKRALYWRVRAMGATISSPWSRPARFHVRADGAPLKRSAGPGFVRWSSIPGATGYEVSFLNRGRTIATTATAADLRDYYAAGGPAKAQWRVRAQRRLYGSDKRALPVVSYGPWSATFTTPVTLGSVRRLATVSDGASERGHVRVPVFLFPSADRAALRHVYVMSDAACTDVVFNSAVVHGSGFAPRAIQLVSDTHVSVAANDSPVYGVAGRRIKPSESGTNRATASASNESVPRTPAAPAAPDASAAAWAPTELAPGRYYWTVVPVERRADRTYHDLKLPKVACKAAKGSFVITAPAPTLGSSKAPFVTGFSTNGRLASAATWPPRVYGNPLVSWKPVPGASRYEVEWTRSKSRWPAAIGLRTFGTAASLPLSPGTWWYRVRGVDEAALGDGTMSWSGAVRIDVTTPTFAVIG